MRRTPKIEAVEPRDDYTLLLTFENSEQRVYDMRPELSTEVFEPLKDLRLFRQVQVVRAAHSNGQKNGILPTTCCTISASRLKRRLPSRRAPRGIRQRGCPLVTTGRSAMIFRMKKGPEPRRPIRTPKQKCADYHRREGASVCRVCCRTHSLTMPSPQSPGFRRDSD